ncbi:MAG: MFS transporter [Anaerolineae bacterium]
MQNKVTLKETLIPVTGLMAALGLSLFLLVNIGYRDALVAYTGYEFDKLGAQGDVIRQSMRPFLLTGLSLEQFPGFKPLTDPLLQSDPDIEAIYIENEKNEIVFINQTNAMNVQDTAKSFRDSPYQSGDEESTFNASQNREFLRATLVLEEKFGSFGKLHLVYNRNASVTAVNLAYQPVWAVAFVLWLIALPLAFWFAKSKRFKESRWMASLYSGIFLTAAFFVIGIMLTIYTTGVNRKANALTHSLAQRLAVPLEIGLDLTHFTGLDEVLQTYHDLDPDIGYITLNDADQVSISAGSQSSQQGYMAHTFLIQQNGNADLELNVQLGIPLSVVYVSLWRGARNFLILFIATVFLANLIFSLNQALQEKIFAGKNMASQQKEQLNIIRPFYFLIVFAEGLHASFLPQHLQGWATNSGYDPAVISTVFTLYFLGFVAALLPSGWLIRKLGIRKTLIIGAFIYALSMIALAFAPLFWLIFPIRFLAGVGQGVLYIAVQGYILEAARKRQTQAAAIIVFGYNGGMISGTAIGALIAVYLSFSGVFLVGASIATLFLIYALTLIPAEIKAASSNELEPVQAENLKARLLNVGRDWNFIKTMLLIGIPTKAVLTGVTVFALPLILSNLGYRQDDIGMILMLYAAGVLFSSRYAARLVDGGGRADRVLLIGSIGGGLGLVLMGQIDAIWLARLGLNSMGLIVIMLGMLILGLAHGFIHAPIVTYIAETKAAEKLGKSSATSLYRFLERIGHVSGPIIVSQLLLIVPRQSQVMLFTGLALIGFALLFSLNFGQKRTANAPNHKSTLSLGGD